MVYGAHHVQGHVADVVSVVLCLLWGPGYHHVGISNGLDLEGDREEQLLHRGHSWIKCIRVGGGTQTLKTRCFSLSVSNSVYMVLSMETTCIGVMWLQMRVNPTTSLKRMVTSGNTWRREIRKLMRGRERRGREALVGQICVYAFNAKIQRDLTVNLIFTVAKSLKET